MKTAEEVKPNYAPIYAAALYPKLAKLFVDNGYALAVHGSLARDFDLIAVPWAKKTTSHTVMVKKITTEFDIQILSPVEKKNHGRIAYSISVGFGSCALDLSFFPNSKLRKN